MLDYFCVPFLSESVAIAAMHDLLAAEKSNEMQLTRRIPDFDTY